MAVSTTGSYRATATVTKVLGAFTGSLGIDVNGSLALAAGTGLNQADKVYYARPTIGGSATLTLDVATAGGLFDVYGDAFAIARLKMVVIKSDLTLCPNTINWQRPASNGVPIFGLASGNLPVRPGGTIVWYAPDLTGVVVTAATGDLMDFVNTAAGNVQPEILIVGASV